MLPSSSAENQTSYTFSDGGICYLCTVKQDSLDYFSKNGCKVGDFTRPSSDFYCSAPGGACDGYYFPPGFSSGINNTREITGYDKCLYSAYDFVGYINYAVEICCFKPGSPVCLSNFLVHYSELIFGTELM